MIGRSLVDMSTNEKSIGMVDISTNQTSYPESNARLEDLSNLPIKNNIQKSIGQGSRLEAEDVPPLRCGIWIFNMDAQTYICVLFVGRDGDQN